MLPRPPAQSLSGVPQCRHWDYVSCPCGWDKCPSRDAIEAAQIILTRVRRPGLQLPDGIPWPDESDEAAIVYARWVEGCGCPTCVAYRKQMERIEALPLFTRPQAPSFFQLLWQYALAGWRRSFKSGKEPFQ